MQVCQAKTEKAQDSPSTLGMGGGTQASWGPPWALGCCQGQWQSSWGVGVLSTHSVLLHSPSSQSLSREMGRSILSSLPQNENKTSMKEILQVLLQLYSVS